MSSAGVTRLGNGREVAVHYGRADGKIELEIPGGVYVSLTADQARFIGFDLVAASRKSPAGA